MTHKPATPLPWIDDGSAVIGNDGGPGFCYVAEQACKSDRAYIVHACNAYPRLVSALRDARMRLWQWDSHPSSRAVPEIDALLRELGEE